MSKIAVIVGSQGQDGRFLFELLVKKGYSVIGLDRGVVRSDGNDWQKRVDITDREQVASFLQAVQPDEVYYLAAFHHSSQDAQIDEVELFEKSYTVHVFSYLNFLEGARLYSPKTRIFYAASSLIFGEVNTEAQDETTPFQPNNPYGITKLDGLLISRLYREKYGLFAAVGIFYNHESEYRAEKFVSMKVVVGAVNIKKGTETELTVGDLSVEVDWGYAPDYVEAAYRILQLEKPDEFIIATGQKHAIQDLVSIAFEHVGLDWRQYVRENKAILTRKRLPMVGNAEKLKRTTGWQPRVGFEEMIQKMVDFKMQA
ncbi:MAG: GDP-mannose 4,6-dehydratase [Candidatus Moranbacteria bacterium]|nr:GDP-mannose 4,6-dehydratase [Candidatus Moranbacteria bacterium]